MNSVKALVKKIPKISQLHWLPWGIAGATLAIALFHEIFRPPWVGEWTGEKQAIFWAVALVVLVLAYLVADRVVYIIEERERLLRRAEEAERLVGDAYKRLEAIFQISQKFVEASDESEVIELMLQLSVDMVGATGASFVPLDEHGQPLAAISRGELPFPVMNDWVEYLASPAVRDRCKTCETHNAVLDANTTCPLLKGPFLEASGVFCFPLRRGEREFGVLNLFVANMEKLDKETQAFLQTMIDETSLALEGVRLRRRELAALRQMQAVREKTDLKAMLTSLLEDVHQTLDSDFAMLVVKQDERTSRVTIGDFPTQGERFMEGILQGVIASGEPVLLGDVAGDPYSNRGVRSLMAAPLRSSQHQVVGALLVGKRGTESFHQRQLAVLQTITGQVALIAQNANLIAEVEYKTMIQERTRLAREIHDGLAQTLGFLKLQAAQMQNYLARNEMERLRQSAKLYYSTLSEAYQDARQAIDGLRIGPSDSGLAGWLVQTVEEFKDLSDLEVDLQEVEIHADLPLEVHAQLIRIVQEALSNVRKHAHAQRVCITCHESEGDLWLEIQDDGRGFAPDDIPGPSQHGLRGMRERAELIGADFQIVSRPKEGTTMRVRLPLADMRGWQGAYSDEVIS